MHCFKSHILRLSAGEGGWGGEADCHHCLVYAAFIFYESELCKASQI